MKNRFFRIMIVFVAVMLSFATVSVTMAYAGMSDVTVASDSTFAGEIGKANWYYTDGIYGESDSIVFGSESNEDSRILSRIKVDDVGQYGREKAMEATIVLKISSLGTGERFMIGFGMRSAAAKLGCASSTTVYFTNSDSGLQCGVFKTDESEKEIVISEAKAFSGNAAGSDIALNVVIKSDGGINVTANNTVICDEASAGAYFVGYFGMGQSAQSLVKITSCSVTSGAYDTPVTPEVSEADFTNDEFNANEWYTVMSPSCYAPSTMNVSGGRLNFVNTGQSSICTMYMYSNFEFTFDMPYLLKSTEYNSAGDIIKPHSSWWGISFGCPSYEGWAGNMLTSAHAIGFQPSTGHDATATGATTHVAYQINGKTTVAGNELVGNYNLWDPANEGKTYTFKLSVVDGTVGLFIKTTTETDWFEILSADIGYTPLGYVGILGMGHTAEEGNSMIASGDQKNITVANFSLDNLRVVNKDQDAQIEEVPFKSNRIEIPSDFSYTNTWKDSDLLAEKLESGEIPESESVRWPWIAVIGAAGICAISVIAAVVIVLGKKGEKKKS